MQKALFIAEKPSLMRSVQKVYESHKNEIPYEITFVAQRGHLLTLMLPDEIDESQKEWKWDNLPFHPEEHGGWQYKIIQEKKVGNNPTSKDRFDTIKRELKSNTYDFVIHAGDADQEGELLVRIVLSQLNNKLPVKRFWNNNATETGLLEALINLRDDDNDEILVNLLKAGYVRQHSDYRIGMNISEAASLKMKDRVACGRVKTPILSIVCQREEEIKNFTPVTTFGIKANYAEGFSGQYFVPKGNSEKNDEEQENAESGLVYFGTEQEAKDFISKLSSPAKIVEYKTDRTETLAPKLFKLSTAQIEAGKLGYKPSDTLDIIQSLYEKGYVSYPRTACEYITSDENLGAILKAIHEMPELSSYVETVDTKTIYKVKACPKWVNDKATKEEGHTALIPTYVKPQMTSLSYDEQTIYKMIAKRFLAIFLPPLVQDKTTIIADISGYLFKTNGKTLVSPGFSTLFGTSFKDISLPLHKEGDLLDVDSFDVAEKTTTCPKRFTEHDLIKVCESPSKYLFNKELKEGNANLTIGQESTRSSIIKNLIERDKYLTTQTEKSVSYVIPTETGMIIYQNLKDCKICKVDMTAEWERKLEQIRKGETSADDVEKDILLETNSMILEIKEKMMSTIKNENSKGVIATCPSCGGDIIAGPKNYFCSNWNNGCKNSSVKSICGANISPTEFIEALSGKVLTKKMSKNGSSWNQKIQFNKATGSWDFIKEEAKESHLECPLCSAKLQITDRNAKCPDCNFILWKTICGKTLTDHNVEALLTCGETGVIKGFRSKAGKSFDAKLKMKPDYSGVEFEFSKN